MNVRFGHTGGNAFSSAAGSEGIVAVDAILGYADARDLDLAVRQGAADLAALGSTESLDVRRAQALGVMARSDLTLDLNGDVNGGLESNTAPTSEPAEPEKPAKAAKTVKARQVVIYAHLAASAVTGARSGSDCDLARVEGHGWVTTDQVRAWCGPGTEVVIKPVIDVTDCIHVDSYEIPARLQEQVTVRDPACVFPWCHRTARRTDCDHVKAYTDGGPTCSCNLAPLCRRHHRLKTHTGWSYDHLGDSTYLWVTPHDHRLRRDPTGTTLLDRGCGCHPPHPPPATEPPGEPEP